MLLSSFILCLCGSVRRGRGHQNNAVGISTVLALRLSRFTFEALLLSGGGFVFSVNAFLPVDSVSLCGHCADLLQSLVGILHGNLCYILF